MGEKKPEIVRVDLVPGEVGATSKFQKFKGLLANFVKSSTGQAPMGAAQEMAGKAYGAQIQNFDRPGVENRNVAAETEMRLAEVRRLEAEAVRIRAEAKLTEAQAKKLEADTQQVQIESMIKLADLFQRLNIEPQAIVDKLGNFSGMYLAPASPKAIGEPTRESKYLTSEVGEPKKDSTNDSDDGQPT